MLKNFLERDAAPHDIRSTCAATPSPARPPRCATAMAARRARRRRVRRRPDGQCAAGAHRRPCSARRRRCSCPRGTQSNLCALMSHCQRGDEYIVGQMAHTYRWEGGGAAVLGSMQPQPLANQPDGTLALADIEAAIKPDDAHFARTRLLCLENTWAARCCRWPTSTPPRRWRTARGLATHLDGARLFNAAVAIGRAGARDRAATSTACRCASARAWARRSARRWCGSRELDRARPPLAQDARRRHAPGRRAGGGRAACARPPRRRAWPTTTRMRTRLAEGLQGLPGVTVEPPQTNIVFVDAARRARPPGCVDAPARRAACWPPACTGCASSPTSTSTPTASTAPLPHPSRDI